MKSVVLKAALAAGVALAIAAPFAASNVTAQQPADGEALFNARCKTCHDPAIDRAPNRTALAAMRASDIVDILTNGVMAPMAGGMSAADKQAVARFLTEMPDAHPATPPAASSILPTSTAATASPSPAYP